MSKSDTNIYPVKIELTDEEKQIQKKWDILPDILPKNNFIMLIHAPPRSGKSVLIMNLIYNDAFKLKKIFNKIVFLSPTLEADKTLRHLYDDEDIIKIYDYNELENIDGIIDGIVDDQKENKGKESVLLVLDDCVGLLGNTSKNLNRLCTRYRHFNVSMIITSQNYKSFGVLMRNCASHWIFFNTNMLKERKKIMEDMNTFPNFENLYNTAVNERYSFLYIDMNALKLYKKFNELIYNADDHYKNNNNNNNINNNNGNEDKEHK